MSEAEQGLMGAVFGQDVKQARLLLCEHGPSLLSGHGGGGITSTAILYAAEAGHAEMCDLIVAHGGVEVFKKGIDVHRLGPVDYAQRGGHTQLAEHLKAMEARVRKKGSVLQQTTKSDRAQSRGKAGVKVGDAKFKM
jgi:hypothetical protein